MPHTGNHERIIFAAPCYEKKELFRTGVYGIMLITRDRMIIAPISGARDYQDRPQKKEGEIPAEVKPVRQQAPGHSRTRESSQLESLGSHAGDYLDRDPNTILSEEKDARAILLGEITEIIITRVRSDSRSSRWLSVLFALYPLEPAGARYSVDYQLTITTPGREYTFITPFSLILKQFLVDLLGERVHEIVDEYAPLL
jgi:hypothetical protein